MCSSDLDAVDVPLHDVSGNLRDLAWLNRWTGTTQAALRAIQAMLPTNESRRHIVLDVGTGAGDLPQAALHWAAQHGQPLHVWGGDFHRTVLTYAHANSHATGWLRLDARRLPIADQAVDVAVCVQVAHHLEPEPLRGLLAELRRVSRIGFVVVDLERSTAAYAAIWLLTRAISTNRLTRCDGPLSARRAYTRREIAALAAQEGIKLNIVPLLPFRWIATWKRKNKPG